MRVLVIFCRPTIEITAANPTEAHYVCKGPGNPPKQSQTIEIADQGPHRERQVTTFASDNQKLHRVPSGIFESYKNLNKVTLKHAHIGSLTQSNFKYANSLQYLTINGNNIPELGYQLFYYATNLIFLDLQSNGIQFVNKNAFQNLNHIQQINLNYNHISMMHASTFAALNTLKYVGLYDNACVSGQYYSLQELNNQLSRSSCGQNYADPHRYFNIYRKRN